MSKNHCIDCMRFDRPHREGEPGFCTQCGEDTSADAPSCHWFTPRRKDDEAKED